MSTRIVFDLNGKEISLNSVKDVKDLKNEVDAFLNNITTEDIPPLNGEVEKDKDLIMENNEEYDYHVVKIKELKNIIS